MYRGLDRLLGVDALAAEDSRPAEVDALARRWEDHDLSLDARGAARMAGIPCRCSSGRGMAGAMK